MPDETPPDLIRFGQTITHYNELVQFNGTRKWGSVTPNLVAATKKSPETLGSIEVSDNGFAFVRETTGVHIAVAGDWIGFSDDSGLPHVFSSSDTLNLGNL